MEITLRFSNRERYGAAVRHIFNHPEKYAPIVRGRDYGAVFKDRRRGCGYYITYKRTA